MRTQTAKPTMKCKAKLVLTAMCLSLPVLASNVPAEAQTSGGRNPGQISILHWYDANQATSFAVGNQGASGPESMAFDGANMWITNANDNTVTKMRVTDGFVLGVYATGNKPEGIAFDGANMWITNNNDNTVTKLHASDGANLGTFSVGHSPFGMAYDGANVCVSNYGDSTVSKLRAGNTPVTVTFDRVNIWVVNIFSNSVSKL